MTARTNARTVGVWFAISLALVTLLGPSGTDMYLASLPDIVRDLDSTATQGQLTLSLYLLAMGAGQLIFGPITDAYGRRGPLLIALIAFFAASLGAAFTPTMGVLLVARVVQGLAASMTLVVALSSVRDRAEGARAAQLFALLMTIEGLIPVLAPTLGGFIDSAFGWRAVLLTLAGITAIALANTTFSLPESLPAARRSSLHLPDVVRAYGRIAKDPAFLLPTLGLSAVFFFLFAYIGGATFVYQESFGLSASTFGLVFGCTGLAVMFGAIIAGRSVTRWGAYPLALMGSALVAAGAALAVGLTLAGCGLWGIVAGMFISLLGLGLAESTLMALAMDSQTAALGSTAALLGAFQLIISSAATPIVGTLVALDPLVWLLFLLATGAVSLVIVWVGARRATRHAR
ncbi:multidrug effflux MFS transporter [Leucobacter sp. 1207-22]|uniref:multidrug effflux MFS transporter n=1 Tax=Leucobacter sp. 1207-22 TaxID=2604456 RepID=UPI004063C664